MSCQKILSMLSMYVDGEVHAQDAALIKEHLANCASCAHEFEELRRVTTVLGITPEIDPPAFLLEQIEAATINRPTLLGRLQTALNSLVQFPQGVRWAAASVTAACALVIILVSQPGEQRIAKHQAIKPQPSSVVATQPSPEKTAVQDVPQVVAKADVKSNYTSRTSIRHKAIVTNTLAHKDTFGQPKPAVKVTPKDEASAEEVNVADASESTEEVVKEQPKPDTKEVMEAKAIAYQEARIKQEADALAEVRAQLAARNKQRKLDAHTERIEGKKYSVELASIRF